MGKLMTITAKCPEHGEFSREGYIFKGDYHFGDIPMYNKMKFQTVHKNGKDYIVVVCEKCGRTFEINPGMS